MRTDTRRCRHGIFTFYPDDEYVGRSLALYGEYSEDEVEAMRQILRKEDLRPGDVVIEVGANIGALTIPMARMLAEVGGTVYAFEPQPENYELLVKNIKQNDIHNVRAYQLAVSNAYGELNFPCLDELGHRNFGRIEAGHGSIKVKTVTLDEWFGGDAYWEDQKPPLRLEKLRLLKIDAEGHELQVLRGAVKTIERLRPVLYVENDREEKSVALVAQLVDMHYRLWWHRAPLWNPGNYLSEQRNVFGRIMSFNMLCFRDDPKKKITIEDLDEIADLRDDNKIFEREIERFERIVANFPDDMRARLMLAHYHHLMQHTDRSAELLAENLRVDPGHLGTKLIYGLHQLQQGNWEEGWKLYETRYQQRRSKPFGDRPHHGVKWDGKPTDDPVLIWCEQGYGDTIMFGRFIRKAEQLAPNLIVEVPASEYEIFQTSHLPYNGALYRMGRTLPYYTQHCSIPSLPAVLGVKTDADIRCPPYLNADPVLTKLWSERGAPSIGVCLVGSTLSERPYTRNLPTELFEPLRHKYGPFLDCYQSGQFDGFADTAACLANLDLLITVDTAMAHLGGALGVETWLLLSYDPDWRWSLKGDRTVWYESMRIFRQPKFRDWKSVVEMVDAALAERNALVEIAAE